MIKIKVLEIASVPSTVGIGGVSVHVQRLMDWGEEDKELEIALFDYKKSLFNFQLLKLMLISKIVHVHVSNPFLRVLYIILAKFFLKKTIVTIHGNLHRYNSFKNRVVDLSVFLCDIPIVLNDQSYDISIKINNNSKKLSAFIPEKKVEQLENDIIELVKDLKHKYSKLACTNAFKRTLTEKGEEIYGIDFLIEYFSKHNNMALIVSDPSGDYANFYENIILPDNIQLISKPHSFCEILKLSDFSIRATATDGDALSIRESLYLGKPVIATNRVSRPLDVILFKYNDVFSLHEAINVACEKIIKPQLENAYFDIRKIYLNLV